VAVPGSGASPTRKWPQGCSLDYGEGRSNRLPVRAGYPSVQEESRFSCARQVCAPMTSHRTAVHRLWGGATVESSHMEAGLSWLDPAADRSLAI
jgi:hypothetical protein